MKLQCAAAHLCNMPSGAPIPLKLGSSDPKHICMNCREPVHGGICGIQYDDLDECNRRGIAIFKVTELLSPEGKIEAASKSLTSILCNLCIETLNKDQPKKPNNAAAATSKITSPASTSVSVASTLSASVSVASKSSTITSKSASTTSAGLSIDLTHDSADAGESTFCNNIWKDQHIKQLDGDGWQCLWCDKSFKTKHATRVICHLLKLKGNHIAPCKAFIPPANVERYRKFRRNSNNSSSANKQAREENDDYVEERQQAATTLSLASKRKNCIVPTLEYFGHTSTSKKRSTGKSTIQCSIDAAVHSTNKNSHQSDVRSSNNARLEMAIADFVHSDGLPFSLPQSRRFHHILHLAKTVGPDFKIPNRNKVSGELLNLNFESCWSDNRDRLLEQIPTYGLTVLGDGATVQRMPLINILGMSGNTLPIVLGIHDCTEHLKDGGKKDASFIADLFEGQMEELFQHDNDEHVLDTIRANTDVFYFDGASNVQKAGRVLEAKYPGAQCLHGGEHVISLFFSDISKLKPIKVSIFCIKILFECIKDTYLKMKCLFHVPIKHRHSSAKYPVYIMCSDLAQATASTPNSLNSQFLQIVEERLASFVVLEQGWQLGFMLRTVH